MPLYNKVTSISACLVFSFFVLSNLSFASTGASNIVNIEHSVSASNNLYNNDSATSSSDDYIGSSITFQDESTNTELAEYLIDPANAKIARTLPRRSNTPSYYSDSMQSAHQENENFLFELGFSIVLAFVLVYLLIINNKEEKRVVALRAVSKNS